MASRERGTRADVNSANADNRLYLHMSSKGVELEKTLALRLAPNTVHTHGSLCVAFPHHEKDMEADYHVRADCVTPYSN